MEDAWENRCTFTFTVHLYVIYLSLFFSSRKASFCANILKNRSFQSLSFIIFFTQFPFVTFLALRNRQIIFSEFSLPRWDTLSRGKNGCYRPMDEKAQPSRSSLIRSHGSQLQCKIDRFHRRIYLNCFENNEDSNMRNSLPRSLWTSKRLGESVSPSGAGELVQTLRYTIRILNRKNLF